MKKIIKCIGTVFALVIPFGCVAPLVIQNNNNLDHNDSKTKLATTSSAAAKYEFGASNWNEATITAAFPDHFASDLKANPKELKQLKSDIIIPNGFSAFTPVITTIAEDAGDAFNKAGTLYVRYDYSAVVSQLPSDAKAFVVQSHVYNSFNYLPDYTWSIDVSNLNRNQLASQADLSKVKVIESTKMQRYHHTVTHSGIDDGDGTITIDVDYANLPNALTSHKQVTITNFYNNSDFKISDWGDLKDAAPSKITKQNIIDMMTNQTIVLGDGLKGLTPTITLNPDNIQGSLGVTLTYVDPLVISGKVVLHHDYKDLYNVSNYSAVIDLSVLDQNKLPSKVTVAEITKAIKPSPAIMKYGGSLQNVVIQSTNDATGNLTIIYEYPDLKAIVPGYKFGQLVEGYNMLPKINMDTDLPSALKNVVPSNVATKANNDYIDFVDWNKGDTGLQKYVYSKTNPTGVKPTIINVNDEVGTFTVKYDFSKTAGWPPIIAKTYSHDYTSISIEEVVTNNPPQKNNQADYNVDSKDVTAANIANYITIDPTTAQLMKKDGYATKYKITYNNGKVAIIVVYSKTGEKDIETSPIELDGFLDSPENESWIKQNWYIILIIVAIICFFLLFLILIYKRHKRETLLKQINDNRYK